MRHVELLRRPLDELMAEAREVRARSRGRLVTYSPKVFIPLTKLCRDVCHYCTFARPPRRGERAYMTLDEVLEVARAGERAGCREALFTLGDKPELRYRAAREELARARLRDDARVPRARRAGRARGDRRSCRTSTRASSPRADFELLRPVAASMGLMLETTSERLSRARRPAFRLAGQAARGAPRDARGSRARRACRSRPGS